MLKIQCQDNVAFFKKIPHRPQFEMAAVVESIVAGLTYGYWYNLCCKWDGEVDCSPPMGMYYRRTGCNSYDFVVYGSGAYGATTWGMNDNALPQAAVTSSPFLQNVSGINLNQPSTILANTLCVNNTGANTLSVSRTVTFGSIPPEPWGTPFPPQHPQKEIEYDLIINANLLSTHTYDWYATQTSGFAITPIQPPNYWKIKFRNEATGIQTIRFNATNTCTGETKSLTYDFFL